METTEIIILPDEIKNLALKVSEEKRAEVQNVLNSVFSGTADWKRQVDEIEVKGVDDTMSIALANTARANSKNARLAAEKIFDAKRAEVQAEMSEYKTQDLLWLKAKQTMQILFKEIEDKAKYKADYVIRFEQKKRDELRIARDLELQPYFEFVPFGFDFGSMKQGDYDNFLNGVKLQLQAKVENEKRAEEERIAKEKAEAEERERIRIENEMLKAEALIKEKQLAEERAKIEAERRAMEARAEAERKVMELQVNAILKAEKEANEKMQKELKAKQDEENRKKAEVEARIQEELNKGDAQKFVDYMNGLKNLQTKFIFKSKKYITLYETGNGLISKILVYLTDKIK